MWRLYFIATILILLIPFHLYAQEKRSEYFITTGITLNQMPETRRLGSITDFGIRRNTNEYKLGLVTQFKTDNAESLSETLKLTGLHFGYDKIIRSNLSWLLFDLKSDLTAQHIKSVWESNFWDEMLQEFDEIQYKSSETIVNLSLGYGIRANFLKHFFFGQSITYGVYYSSNNGEAVTPGAPEYNDDFDFRDYGDFGFQWNFHLTLGFNL